MSKRVLTTDELIRRAVVRQDVESEWMSKMSSNEFRQWEETERMTMTICKHPEHEHDTRLQQQIKFKEDEYRLRKEQMLEWTTSPPTKNGLKHNPKNTCLAGGDIVSSPGCRDAVLTASTCNTGQRIVENVVLQEYGKVNKNGRIYSPDIKWDKYENHVKKHGI